MSNIILCSPSLSKKLPNDIIRVYCGRDYPPKNPTLFNQGLGNPKNVYQNGNDVEINGKMTTWQERYREWLRMQYIHDKKTYNLINEIAISFALGSSINLQCFCYKDKPVIYNAGNDGRCHTEVIADVIHVLLKNRLVIVFGSNRQGFHGSGLAGLVCRGDSGDWSRGAQQDWRKDEWFKNATRKETASLEERRGKRAIVGVSRGYQEGTEGASYGICTVESLYPHREYTSIDEIAKQLYQLLDYCYMNRNKVICMTAVGTGLGGKSPEVMQQTWEQVCEKWKYDMQKDSLPFNLYRTDCFTKKINVNHS